MKNKIIVRSFLLCSMISHSIQPSTYINNKDECAKITELIAQSFDDDFAEIINIQCQELPAQVSHAKFKQKADEEKPHYHETKSYKAWKDAEKRHSRSQNLLFGQWFKADFLSYYSYEKPIELFNRVMKLIRKSAELSN